MLGQTILVLFHSILISKKHYTVRRMLSTLKDAIKSFKLDLYKWKYLETTQKIQVSLKIMLLTFRSTLYDTFVELIKKKKMTQMCVAKIYNFYLTFQNSC
jgi:hypothetical protein